MLFVYFSAFKREYQKMGNSFKTLAQTFSIDTGSCKYTTMS